MRVGPQGPLCTWGAGGLGGWAGVGQCWGGNVWQTGLFMWPCMGAVPLLCPFSGGGNATVKLSPHSTPLELNNKMPHTGST